MRAPVGGLFRHVADLTAELANRGHDVGLVVDAQSSDAQTEAKLAAISSSASLGIHRFPIPRVMGAADIGTPFKIRALANSLGVTILHGHGAKGGFGARLAALGDRNKHALYTPHGGVLHFDPKSMSGRLFMGIERALLKSTDALIFESEYAKNTFAARIGVTDIKHDVIHNGLLAEEFEPVADTANAAEFVFIGELRMLKGIDLLIEALQPLVAPSGAPARLVIAGDGPDRDWLVSRIAELGLTERVTLAGVQPARAMFAQGQCVVVPSRAESLPYVVLEAAAAQKPLIATNVGGIPEIFGPSVGELIEHDSADALRAAMQRYLDDPDNGARQAMLRRDFVQSRFSLMGMVDRIEALYLSLAR